ncbi:PAS domain S-box protein [Spirosoma sp. KNUC1025]|uniref:PAS domain S-box protein n=1 Tax=Spirosoma sp. KNUC1025 TaxID=2894082 RepID=UPI003864BB0A|nr:PAS domain S-box protein [Spirosoma sp. KNUC1025]
MQHTPSDQQLPDETRQLKTEQLRLQEIIRGLQAEQTQLDQHWQFLIDDLGETYWSNDLPTSNLHRSAIYYQRLGYLAESSEPIPAWRTLIHPQDLQTWDYELTACRHNRQTVFTVTYRIRKQDGTYEYWLDRGRIFSHSADGQPLRLKGISTALTTQPHRAYPLSRQANRLANLITHLQDGLLLEDEHRTIILVNQHFCELFSVPLSPEQLTGMDCSGMAEQSKHFFKDPETFVQRVNQLLDEKKPVIGEELELADGRIFDRDYIPLFIEGSYAGHLWKYSDITRRKRAEDAALRQKEKYQRIIENMHLGLIEVDLQERIVYTNQSFCFMSGYEADDLIGRVASDTLLNGQNVQVMQEKNDSRLDGAMDTYEVAVTNKQGTAMWWLISGAPLYSDTGEVIGSTGIHLDITKQKQLESELRIAKQEAEHSSRAKELFLANMSHEIRTPMNVILSLGQQLTKTILSDQQHYLLSMINTAASNLLVILNDILDFSKIEAGQLSLEQIGFNLTDLLQAGVQVMANQAQEKNLRLSTRIDAGIAPVVLGDPYRLNQILVNLLSNAIKFTESGSVTVECQGKQQNGQQHIVLRVIDTGIGMDPDFQKTIFNKFTQEDGSIGRRYGGTGLGMSITKQLVDLMGGAISIESRQNAGTTVDIALTFPIGKKTDLGTPEQATPQENLLVSKRILLVEDNEMNRLVVRMILKPYGPHLTEVINGQKAIEALRTDTFDLVLMDVQMPVMDGLEATRIIRREISQSLPVIALTASAIRTEKEECYQVGMNDFLAKPFEEKDLISLLTKWINSAGTEKPVIKSPTKLYDLSKLESISRGDSEFIQQMVQLFCTETPTAVNQLVDAYYLGNLRKVKSIAHRIKPSIDNMGIDSQTEGIRAIDQLAQTGEASNELEARISSFAETITEVVRQLQADF